VYGVYNSQLIRYSRACVQYSDFMDRALSCWGKSYSNKATLLLGWSRRYKDFYRTWLYIWATRRVSYKKKEHLTLIEHLSSPPFLVGSVLLIYLVLCVVLLCVFTFWVPCCDVRYDFRLYLQLFVGWLISYLRYLCCVFVLFVFVLCTLCRQFHWIVHFFLPFRYSLTFIQWHRTFLECYHSSANVQNTGKPNILADFGSK
jgi:hypothetical protein